ncbi:MAG: hypothetical protein KatS3mg009_1983 [Acidimicrobiia bacterium]|nr:MAG: hypothetical protein KatS3mg009_1983 [Acidimicrobiia bacterium]
MRFSVDPWDPAYGASLVESEPAPTGAPVAADVEVPPDAWAPRRPPPATPLPPAIVFVDGVRRVDARTWIEDAPGSAQPGIFASYAAGAVRCDGTATVTAAVVGRGLFSASPAAADVETRAGRFRAHPAKDPSPEALVYALHDRMAACEVRIAEEARRRGDELLVLDGPLRTRGHLPDAVGVVKTHHVRYLPAELDRVVGALGAGERTPLFRVDAPPFSRCSWYLRLPGPDGGPWAGVVRCEIDGALAPARASALADRVSLALPRFASEGHKDSRAPQNLYPIGGLERDLRHRLGDAALVYRALRAASRAGAPGGGGGVEAAAGIEPA